MTPTTDLGSNVSAPPTDPAPTEATRRPTERPDGPSASMSEPLTGGNGVFMGEPLTTDLDAAGYVEPRVCGVGHGHVVHVERTYRRRALGVHTR